MLRVGEYKASAGLRDGQGGGSDVGCSEDRMRCQWCPRAGLREGAGEVPLWGGGWGVPGMGLKGLERRLIGAKIERGPVGKVGR